MAHIQWHMQCGGRGQGERGVGGVRKTRMYAEHINKIAPRHGAQRRYSRHAAHSHSTYSAPMAVMNRSIRKHRRAKRKLLLQHVAFADAVLWCEKTVWNNEAGVKIYLKTSHSCI